MRNDREYFQSLIKEPLFPKQKVSFYNKYIREKWVLISLLAILFSLLFYAINQEMNMVCVQYKQVESVGGCNKFGECAATYTDGSTAILSLPTKNQNICVKREIKENK